MLGRYREEGWRIFVHMWRPQVERQETTTSDADECIRALRVELGNEVDVACCTHDAGPPACWCRKPLPGSVIEFAMRRSVALDRSIVVGSSAADRTMAERIGAAFERTDAFFFPNDAGVRHEG
jgi:histidinol phosphatase-like enzyme